MDTFDLIVATFTFSHKGDEGNEDRVRSFSAVDGSAGVVVCDGVGSIPESGATAETVSAKSHQFLSGRGIKRGVWELDELLARGLSDVGAGATTLVAVGAQRAGLVGHLLVGNGSVIEVVPVGENGKRRLLWTSIVLPQIGEQSGRLALRSVIPPLDGEIRAEKGLRLVPPGAPRLYLACSDGLLSEEDRPEGTAADGSSWREVPAGIARLLERLITAWPALAESEQAEAERLLDLSLREALDDSDLLGDDTTVGALLMRPRPDRVGSNGSRS